MNWKKFFTTRNKTIAVIITVAALCRLLPHPYNFTPIGAIALFSGCYFLHRSMAFIVPMITMLISDLFLYLKDNSFSPDIFVYLAFGLIACIGFLIRGREQRQIIMVASLSGSIVFFILTNFGVWLTDVDYAKTWAGLGECYVKAIPFFRGTVMGDLFYNLVLFGSFALIKWRKPELLAPSETQ